MAGAFLGLVFLFGASLGSFVNVVAWRLPLRISLVSPGSTCPSCGAPIRGLALVPVVGWLFSRGACRACGVPVSARYPLVELTTGLIAMALWLHHAGPTILPPRPEALVFEVVIPFILHFTFAATLVLLTLIDLDWFLLPNRVTFPLTLLGLLSALAIHRQTGVDLAAAAYGALLLGGIPLAIGLAYAFITGRQGLGGGDWKLGLAIGAWLGPKAVPFIFVAAPVFGLLAALLFRKELARATPPALPGEDPEAAPEPSAEPAEPAGSSAPTPGLGRLHIPFGPFLALAALGWLLFGPELQRLFDSLARGR